MKVQAAVGDGRVRPSAASETACGFISEASQRGRPNSAAIPNRWRNRQ